MKKDEVNEALRLAFNDRVRVLFAELCNQDGSSRARQDFDDKLRVASDALDSVQKTEDKPESKRASDEEIYKPLPTTKPVEAKPVLTEEDAEFRARVMKAAGDSPAPDVVNRINTSNGPVLDEVGRGYRLTRGQLPATDKAAPEVKKEARAEK